jgi:hypothetical protein
MSDAWTPSIRPTPADQEGSDAAVRVLLHLAAQPTRADTTTGIASYTGIATRMLNSALPGLAARQRIARRPGLHADDEWRLATPEYLMASQRLQQHCAASRAAAEALATAAATHPQQA